MKTSWFFSKEHELNSENVKTRKINSRQPVKIYRGEELKALAASMGYATSEKAGRCDIKAEHLPSALKKFVK